MQFTVTARPNHVQENTDDDPEAEISALLENMTENPGKFLSYKLHVFCYV